MYEYRITYTMLLDSGAYDTGHSAIGSYRQMKDSLRRIKSMTSVVDITIERREVIIKDWEEV